MIVVRRRIEPQAPVTLQLLSLPPSVNNLYFNTGKGRARSAEYRKWSNAEEWNARLQFYRFHTFTSPVKIVVRIGEPKRRRDIDNIWKPICDLLVKLAIIPDDDSAWARDERIYIDPSFEGVEVTIAPLSPELMPRKVA